MGVCHQHNPQQKHTRAHANSPFWCASPSFVRFYFFFVCVCLCVCVSVESLKEERWGGTMCRLTPIRCTRCSIWEHLCMYARASNGRFTSLLLKPQSACSPYSRSPPFLLPRGPCFRGRTIRPPGGMCASSGVCHALLTCFCFFRMIVFAGVVVHEHPLRRPCRWAETYGEQRGARAAAAASVRLPSTSNDAPDAFDTHVAEVFCDVSVRMHARNVFVD